MLVLLLNKIALFIMCLRLIRSRVQNRPLWACIGRVFCLFGLSVSLHDCGTYLISFMYCMSACRFSCRARISFGRYVSRAHVTYATVPHRPSVVQRCQCCMVNQCDLCSLDTAHIYSTIVFIMPRHYRQVDIRVIIITIMLMSYQLPKLPTPVVCPQFIGQQDTV